MDLSHDNCLKLLAHPTTQVILETLGFEYSDRGQSEYRKARPDIIPSLVRAIVKELGVHSIFPTKFRDQLPTSGRYIRKQGNEFLFMDMDKPSVWVEYTFETGEGAARAYLRKLIDSYWHQADIGSDIAPKLVRSSW